MYIKKKTNFASGFECVRSSLKTMTFSGFRNSPFSCIEKGVFIIKSAI